MKKKCINTTSKKSSDKNKTIKTGKHYIEDLGYAMFDKDFGAVKPNTNYVDFD